VIVAAVNIIATIVLLRAPGLTVRRVPLFSFSVLVSSAMLLLSIVLISPASALRDAAAG